MTGFDIKPVIAATDFAISTTLSYCITFGSSNLFKLTNIFKATKKILHMDLHNLLLY
jgi:hypothetical protein